MWHIPISNNLKSVVSSFITLNFVDRIPSGTRVLYSSNQSNKTTNNESINNELAFHQNITYTVKV